MGAGAAAFGVLATTTGYPIAFAVTAGVMLVALAPARRERKEPQGSEPRLLPRSGAA